MALAERPSDGSVEGIFGSIVCGSRLSPDGRQVAIVLQRNGKQNLRIGHTTTKSRT